MNAESNNGEGHDRRTFFSRVTTGFMLGSLALGYGTAVAMAGRFLYPARKRKTSWQFVTRIADLKAGNSITYRAPSGEKIAVACRGITGALDDYIALSSTCPHLGCQVHWQGHEKRFFCPCHNGVFDPDGIATAGPPAEAKQNLSAYPLRLDRGSLMIEVPVEFLTVKKA